MNNNLNKIKIKSFHYTTTLTSTKLKVYFFLIHVKAHQTLSNLDNQPKRVACQLKLYDNPVMKGNAQDIGKKTNVFLDSLPCLIQERMLTTKTLNNIH